MHKFSTSNVNGALNSICIYLVYGRCNGKEIFPREYLLLLGKLMIVCGERLVVPVDLDTQ